MGGTHGTLSKETSLISVLVDNHLPLGYPGLPKGEFDGI